MMDNSKILSITARMQQHHLRKNVLQKQADEAERTRTVAYQEIDTCNRAMGEARNDLVKEFERLEVPSYEVPAKSLTTILEEEGASSTDVRFNPIAEYPDPGFGKRRKGKS